MKRASEHASGLTTALLLLAVFGTQSVPNPLALSGGWQAASAARRRTGRTLVVTNPADSGAGTLRQALLDAQPGDTINFDPDVFPPGNPVTISLASHLPPLERDNVILTGEGSGVIIDGSVLPRSAFVTGIDVVSAFGVTVEGLEVRGFPGAGIVLAQSTDSVVQDNVLTDNELGVGTWESEAARNMIRGNEVYSNVIGISVSHGAHEIIVEDNAVYGNDEFGVSVVHQGSSARLTRNSIYDNGRLGIHLDHRGNDDQSVPQIIGFDLAAGTVTGIACANCTVEVFSDSSDEGEIYEGRTRAHRWGDFTFDKGAPLTGPHLTATATDAAGKTSEFSYPTSGTRRSSVLQVGNSLPRTRFQTSRSRELEDNRIGDMLSLRDSIRSERDMADYVEKHDQLGLKWVRLSLDYFDWSEVEATGGYSRFYVDPAHDQLISELADQGVTILYCLVFWDDQIEPVERGYARFKTEGEIQRYLNYARFIARHFKGRIQYYEILNETFFGEDSDFTQQNVELADYINLVRRVLPVIREEDSQARIVAGPAPAVYQQETYDYQIGILESDVMPLVDAGSWHPGSYPQEYSDVITYLYQVPQTVQEIQDTAAAHGFTGEYIVEELQWPTAYNPSPTEPWFMYSERVAAKYYARGIIDHLGMDVVATLAGTHYHRQLPKMDVIRNLSTLMAGADPITLPVEIESESTDFRQYSFSLSDGSHLIALWRDVFAEEYVPGVEVAVALDGFSEYEVTGVHVLNGFEQPMITDNEDGNLVVRDLLVKDYPIILRLTPTREVFLPVVVR